MDSQTLKKLEQTEEEFERLRISGNVRGAAEKDSLFHMIIVEAAYNRRLYQALTHLHEEIFRYQLEDLKEEGILPRVRTEHRALLEAFHHRDEDAAVNVIRTHLQSTTKDLLGRLKD